MTNHVHLLVTPQTPDGPAKLMQSVGRRYVQYINRTYRRSGTLWKGRFKSSAIQTESYLLLCQRYIELNPVRAGMVSDPAHYRWSSYRYNSLGQSDERLTPHRLYLELGKQEYDRRVAYRALFRSELDDEAIKDMQHALSQCQPVGNEKFKDAISLAAGVRRTRLKRGRTEKVHEIQSMEEQTDFRF